MSRGGRGGRRGNKSAVMTLFQQSKDMYSNSTPLQASQPGAGIDVFPPLDVRRLAPLKRSQVYEYMVTVSAQHVARMRDSPFFINSATRKRDVERYSDRLAPSKSGAHEDKKLKIDPSVLPSELQWTTSSRSKDEKAHIPLSEVDISAIIARLEETDLPDGAEEIAVTENKPEEAGGASSDEEDGDPTTAAADDFGEDDEDNDYVQSYFDNGETYTYEDDLGGGADDPYD